MEEKVYKIFISSPSGLKEERSQLKTYLEKNIFIEKCRFEVLLWEKDLANTTTEDVQKEINEQLLSKTDILIGLFCDKFGSETKRYESGTVEEIEECINNQKPVMLYFIGKTFSTTAVSQDDLIQMMKVVEFKQKYSSKGVFSEVKSIDEVKERLAACRSEIFGFGKSMSIPIDA